MLIEKPDFRKKSPVLFASNSSKDLLLAWNKIQLGLLSVVVRNGIAVEECIFLHLHEHLGAVLLGNRGSYIQLDRM